MRDDVKLEVDLLRNMAQPHQIIAFPSSVGRFMNEAANLIESLAAELAQVKQERDGLSIMLSQAQTMLETRTRERDAAAMDMKKLADKIGDYTVCTVCSHEKDHCRSCVFEWRGMREEDAHEV